jgi:hypothetical protein
MSMGRGKFKNDIKNGTPNTLTATIESLQATVEILKNKKISSIVVQHN